VLRNGKPDTVKVVTGNLAQVFPDRFGAGEEQSATKPEGTTVSFGMSIENIPQARRDTLGVKEAGVLVREVEPNSFAEDVGLLQGDVITAINHQAVTTTDDVKKVQATLKPGDAVAFRILRRNQGGQGQQRDWQTAFLAGTLPATTR